MKKKLYIIKDVSPWMVEELFELSNHTTFDILLLRRLNDNSEKKAFQTLEESGVRLYYLSPCPINLRQRVYFLINFIALHFTKFLIGYNSVIAWKSIYWFCFIPNNLMHYDSIHAQFATQSSLIALLILKYNNKAEYFFTFHAYDIFFNNLWFKILAKNAKKAFSISEYNRKYVISKYNLDKSTAEKLCIVRLGSQKKELTNKPVTKSTLVIGCLSRLVEKKGLIYLLKAIKLVNKDLGIHKIKCIIGGDGPLKKDLEDYISQNNIENIHFIGSITGKEKEVFFRELDLFILPCIQLKNDRDGIPVVYMEALSYGIPIIATNISGLDEICKDNINGFLIDQKNEFIIAEKITYLYKSMNILSSFSNNALVEFNKYNIEKNSFNKYLLLEW